MLDWPRPFGARFHGFAVPAEDLLPQEPIRGKRRCTKVLRASLGMSERIRFPDFRSDDPRQATLYRGTASEPRDVRTDPFS